MKFRATLLVSPNVATERAREFQDAGVDTEHVLLGLLDDPDGLAAKVIVSLGVPLDTLTDTVRSAMTPGEGTPLGHIPFTADSKQVLKETADAAIELQHNYIGTEHMLLGLLRVPQSRAAQVLTGAGLDATRVRDAVAAALAGYQHKNKRS